MQASPVGRVANLFKENLRAVCTDAAASNLACEREVAADRGPQWSTLHTLCDVHVTSRCYSKTFSLMEDHITGMVRCALSLRVGAAMNVFRRCMRDEIADRLDIKFGRCPPDAVAHKKAVLRLFVSHGRKAMMRRLLLVLCPNGDWRIESFDCN